MPYDFEPGDDRSPPSATRSVVPMHPTDLEGIVMLLELAAIDLTPEQGAAFTFDRLLEKANEIGGFAMAAGDARNVFDHSPHAFERDGKRWRLK